MPYSDMMILKSNPKNIARIDSFVERVVKECKLDADMHGNILISLTEAVTNAILHGNNADESKKVEISLRQDANNIAICVKDEGPGFKYEEVPDPTKEENLLKLGGRGVFLMRQLCDKVFYSNNGSQVEICFNICQA